MNDEVAIVVDGVGKTFKLPHEKQNSIKGLFIGMFRGKRSYEIQHVIKDISFNIQKGEFFGIVGRNGSGKSTLLKMLAGVYYPTRGNIHIAGKLTPFIELGVGFNPELSGRENVFLNGALLGFNRNEMRAMYDEIVDFAELEKFMDQKLKNYSSGMQVRLAFSIAIRARSDILLLDEVLAVGDANFQKKCYDYFRQLKREGRTVVFVSHDTNALLEYCDRGILLESGNIIQDGPIDGVVNTYLDLLNKSEAQNTDATLQDKPERWGTGEARVVKASILSAVSGKKQSLFDDKDEKIIVEVTFKALKDITTPVFGVTIFDGSGQRAVTTNTMWSRVKTKNMKDGETTTVSWTVPNVLNSGSYTISPAIADRDGMVTFDWWEHASSFKVSKKVKSIAYINTDYDTKILKKTTKT